MAIAEVAQQPDIGYTPDHDKYLAPVQRRLKGDNLDKTLPPSFSTELKSDLVWDNTDIADRFDWTYEPTATDLEEIEKALQHFKSLGKSLEYVDQEAFPLPNLHSKLGIISMRSTTPLALRLSAVSLCLLIREEIIITYAGIASHIAPIRGRQHNQYDEKLADVVLNHIKDLSKVYDANKIGAPAYTTDKQVFHTDSGHVIALPSLEEAAEGGESKLRSSWRVYKELAHTRPDLIRTLAEPWPAENFGDKTKPYVSRPLLHHQPSTSTSRGRLIIQCAHRTFTGFQGLPHSRDISPITEAQAEALDALHFLVEKRWQFANNLSIFHARDGFTNTEEMQRYLVRLWLRDSENTWEKVYGGVKEERQDFPLEPYIRNASLGAGGESK
ncbi:Clavaminate synthase-like protein [Macroventuria anomochaeta]|uniref:Clavaminate synthase-like protein n=1 Tax=Macroventuria anomochaeta TaxID=301207 RepID=A0ACB6RTR1_9PLEO|nr:Clavaminate synthase-like protein [Macroventuria anomochaeta]KAF2624324.1 Clavaminate synthase-like protein [Macroventuria anomochaeta]